MMTNFETLTREPLPLATVQNAVMEFLRGRDDAVVFGAQAVNAYVKKPREAEEIDLLSMRTAKLATELRDYLSRRFRCELRIRKMGEGYGRRVYQALKSGNRNLVYVRPVESLPLAKRIAKVLIIAPEELIARKVIAYHQWRGQPKSDTDWRDLAMLLLTFPELKREDSPVAERLKAAGADQTMLDVWKELVAQEIKASG
ncbi:MAG: nucleotidyl transferase AbiEii/AbiGii toxin family protein [bacterium]